MTVANPIYSDRIWDADENRWIAAKRVIGDARVTLGSDNVPPSPPASDIRDGRSADAELKSQLIEEGAIPAETTLDLRHLGNRQLGAGTTGSSLSHFVRDVVVVRAKPEMPEAGADYSSDNVDPDLVVSNAGGIVAGMKYTESIGDGRSTRQFPGDLVNGGGLFSTNPDAAVSLAVGRSTPYPAVCGLGNPGPQPIFDRATVSPASVNSGASATTEVTRLLQQPGAVDPDSHTARVAEPGIGSGGIGILVAHQDQPPGVTPPAATNSAGATSCPNYTSDSWSEVKRAIGDRRIVLGPQATQQYLDAPEHLAMVLARYRVAAASIGNARTVLEAGSGEGIGARVLAKGRDRYCGVDNDAEAVRIARQTVGTPDTIGFAELSLTRPGVFLPGTTYDAVVSLDVIEHIDRADEVAFFENLTGILGPYGVCVVGTPSLHMEHLASPQSRAGHVNLFSPERLRDTLGARFNVVQLLFMQDTSLHLGHPHAAHYLVGVGIGPKRGA